MKFRILLLFLVIILMIVFFISYRLYLYQADEPYRNAISLLKEGKYKEAQVAFRYLSQNGHRYAQIELARLYAFGLGVRKDREHASKLLQCNSVNNCISGKAEYGIGIELIKRYGLEKRKEALYWIEKSASFSYEPAIKWLKENN
ncbi:hypothetical protein [Aliikangiella maris]|uniref:Sel1 repeat family protein n=1 Tax=Aliikangiella maris TaxID=3162458 RepID=A0ABV2C0G2_9GAMM